MGKNGMFYLPRPDLPPSHLNVFLTFLQVQKGFLMFTLWWVIRPQLLLKLIPGLKIPFEKTVQDIEYFKRLSAP